MKSQDVRGKSGFYSTSTAALSDHDHEACRDSSDHSCFTIKRRGCLKQSILIFSPLLFFLSLGFYFLSIDVKNSVVIPESNATSVTWSNDFIDFHEEVIVFNTPETNSTVTFVSNDTETTIDSILETTSVAPEKETVVLFPNGNQTEFVIGKNDQEDFIDFLKMANGTFHVKPQKDPLTTPKGFHYSATIPKNDKPTDPTIFFNSTNEANCFSTRIPFCEGVLPYDMVQLPNFASIKSKQELDAMLPYFQLIVQSGCSARAKDFICSILEPECRPVGLRPASPCKLHCKVLAKDCKEFLMETLPLSRIFDCRRYPDWDENHECLNLSNGSCFPKEIQCPDGTCIPSDWVCDGTHDCPGPRPSFDERNCSSPCSSDEFRCMFDGKCVPESWHCDGQLDCLDGSDETSC